MATVTTITALIRAIIRTDALIDGGDILARMNVAVSAIAGGIRLPDGRFSPPLPDLFISSTVATTVNAYADLPATYQRNVFYVADSSGDRILPPPGGDYYDFMLFLNHIQKKDLSEAGSIYRVCIKGKKIYYQGVPSESENLTVMHYRKPVDMEETSDEPDGIPEQYQIPLIKHYVCRSIFGDILEGSRKGRFIYHDNQFNEAMIELIDFIGYDAEPTYMAGDSGIIDLGVCD